jgi:hypothetical protein
MEGFTMQPTLTKVNTWILLAMTAIASVVALLYVSITRDFLPGIVELTAALSVALIFGVVALVPRGSRQALLRRLNEVRVGKLRYLVAAAAVLAATSVLAVLREGFPWPAPLLLVVLLVFFAADEG